MFVNPLDVICKIDCARLKGSYYNGVTECFYVAVELFKLDVLLSCNSYS